MSSVLHLADLAECASIEDDMKTILSCCKSRNACVNISVPVKLLAKLLCFSVSFSARIKQAAPRPPRGKQHSKICAGNLKESDAAWHGDSLVG